VTDFAKQSHPNCLDATLGFEQSVGKPAIEGIGDKYMPKAKIVASQVEDLALIGSTLAEMAMLLNSSEESLDRRFRKNIKRGMARRMILLRRELFVQAMHGDATALKWFLTDSFSEQMRDFERLQKKFYDSLSPEEIDDMLSTIKSCTDFLSSTDKAEVSAEPRTDPGSPRSKLPN
jgi:hypothetical protein